MTMRHLDDVPEHEKHDGNKFASRRSVAGCDKPAKKVILWPNFHTDAATDKRQEADPTAARKVHLVRQEEVSRNQRGATPAAHSSNNARTCSRTTAEPYASRPEAWTFAPGAGSTSKECSGWR